MNCGVIILNYLAYEHTIECVNGFLKQSTENECASKICIVDNCSTNNSYEYLKNYYADADDVDVVKTDKNLGFAKGNNFGFEFLNGKYREEFDFYIIANDDIVLKSDGLFDWIFDNYEKYDFSILGPKIYSINGEYYQSPVPNCTRQMPVLYLRFIKQYLKIAYYFTRTILRINNKQGDGSMENSEYDSMHLDRTLHGSFLVFSRNYFKHYKHPFDEKTYMYMEEDILRLRCDVLGLVMEYSPDYEVDHMQAISTNLVAKDYNKRMIFKTRNYKNSLKRYIEILRNIE